MIFEKIKDLLFANDFINPCTPVVLGGEPTVRELQQHVTRMLHRLLKRFALDPLIHIEGDTVPAHHETLEEDLITNRQSWLIITCMSVILLSAVSVKNNQKVNGYATS